MVTPHVSKTQEHSQIIVYTFKIRQRIFARHRSGIMPDPIRCPRLESRVWWASPRRNRRRRRTPCPPFSCSSRRPWRSRPRGLVADPSLDATREHCTSEWVSRSVSVHAWVNEWMRERMSASTSAGSDKEWATTMQCSARLLTWRRRSWRQDPRWSRPTWQFRRCPLAPR